MFGLITAVIDCQSSEKLYPKTKLLLLFFLIEFEI